MRWCSGWQCRARTPGAAAWRAWRGRECGGSWRGFHRLEIVSEVLRSHEPLVVVVLRIARDHVPGLWLASFSIWCRDGDALAQHLAVCVRSHLGNLRSAIPLKLCYGVAPVVEVGRWASSSVLRWLPADDPNQKLIAVDALAITAPISSVRLFESFRKKATPKAPRNATMFRPEMTIAP